MAGAGQLLGSGKAGRAGADNGDLPAGLGRRHLRLDPAGTDRLVSNGLFDGLDGDRHVLEVQRAGFLAGGGADAAGEFGEIVGRVEVAGSLLPVAIVDEVVPVRDLVVDRAARIAMAERDAAIHAARGLVHHPALGKGDGELAEMADAIGGRLVAGLFALDLEKACYLTHFALSLLCRCLGAR